jgi:hypothetical protein
VHSTLLPVPICMPSHHRRATHTADCSRRQGTNCDRASKFERCYVYGARFSAEIHTQAKMRVTNGIPLGCPLFLPVDTVNCVQTLKAPCTFSEERQKTVGWATSMVRCSSLSSSQPPLVTNMNWDRNVGKRAWYGACFPTENCTRGCRWSSLLLA